MDFQNQYQNQMQNNVPRPARPMQRQENAMSTAAMVTGIVGAVSIFFLPLYLPFFLGSISITLALLSKGSERKLSPHAKTGLITSACSLVVNAMILIFIICFLFFFSSSEFLTQYREQFNDYYEQLYGESFDDAMDDAFGIGQ